MTSVQTDNTMALYHALNRIDELEALNEKLTAALKEKMIVTEGASVLRKQAEALVAVSDEIGEGTYQRIAKSRLRATARRFYDKANAIEKGERDE